MERKAFDGRVTFETIGVTVRGILVRNGFMKAVPEASEFPDDFLQLFSNLIEIVSRTKSVTIQPGETDEEILALVTFWKFVRSSQNYRAIWDMFLDLPSLKINNEWMENGLNPAEDAHLLAPAEVQINSPTDEELESMGEQGESFLERVGNL